MSPLLLWVWAWIARLVRNEETTNVLFVLAMGIMMVTASALFTAGYPSVLAKKSSIRVVQ